MVILNDKGSFDIIESLFEPLPLDTCRVLVAQIVLVVEHMHSLNISHRDIKPQNLLLDDKCNIKLCDFGESKII